MEITLKFDISEVNLVLQMIAKQPFEVAEPLITKIKAQAQAQVDAAQKLSAESSVS